jgi:hypothetical protein
MRIQGVGGNPLSWVDAIRAKKASQTVSEQILASDEGDPAAALEMTSSILFGTPIKQESSADAVRRESKEIQKKEAAQVQSDITNDIKLKLSDAGVDPVALGVVKSDEWSTISDPQMATNIAKIAALAHEKSLSDKWQAEAMKPASPSKMSFDPTMKGGRVMSSAGANEETRGRTSSIGRDPFKLDQIAASANEHDDSVKQSRARLDAQKEAKRKSIEENQPPAEAALRAGTVRKSGGLDSIAFVHKVPKNQVSMLDTLGEGKLPPEELKAKMQELFNSKVADNKSESKKAADERRESIQRPKETNKSWETVAKPTSTADLHERLLSLWTPEEPGK